MPLTGRKSFCYGRNKTASGFAIDEMGFRVKPAQQQGSSANVRFTPESGLMHCSN